MLLKRFCAVGLALSLAACQTPPAPEVLPDIFVMPLTQVVGDTAEERFDSRQGILKKIGYWQLSGKLTVSGNERPTNAQLLWNQRGQVSDLDLSGPVGIGSVNLEISPSVSVLTRGNGRSIRAQTPEELIAKVIGWPMPASLLRWWIVGAADEGQLLSIDDQGRPEQFQYREWTVSYGDYIDVEGLPLPDEVSITDGHLTVKLSRARWRLRPVPTDVGSKKVRIPGVDD